MEPWTITAQSRGTRKKSILDSVTIGHTHTHTHGSGFERAAQADERRGLSHNNSVTLTQTDERFSLFAAPTTPNAPKQDACVHILAPFSRTIVANKGKRGARK